MQIKWHDPRASVVEGLVSRGDRRLGAGDRAGVARRRHLPGVERALPARPLGGGDGGRRASTSTGTATATAPRTRCCPWDHLSAGLHKDFLWQDWRDALDEVGLEDCRWTPCYDCGACTGYGIEHVVASAVPPAGGSQGTGQDLQWGGEVPVTLSAPQAGGGGRMKQRVRFTKLGKVRFLSHRDLARVWERALRRAGVRVAYSEGFSPRPRLSFGLALSTGYESLGEYLDIDLADDARARGARRRSSTRRCRTGMEAQVGHPHPARHRLPPAGGHQLVVADRGRRRRRRPPRARPSARALARRRAADHGRAQGQRDRPRRPPGHPRPRRADGSVLVAELATQPRSLRPAELLRALDPTWTAGSVLRTHQWTSVDGARCEPIPFGDLGARGATSTPHAEARA